ncbi:hypothetical protein [Youngiibacter multivorans]|uniref:Uncharacterized protein n=1 Tax=Youngiibacter multivorans TaxID=937251 RepID=A0ABS4G7G6_9CLOT|nr:hypothetical protein [Youngiibacter multivorans]MBP1920481.1 hypothetical protein [Youngiibacter multivorans]
MLEAKEGYCTTCERLSYFLPVEEGYQCQNCQAINTMKGPSEPDEAPDVKAELFADVNDPPIDEIL